MMYLGIDPGPTESAYCIIGDHRRPLESAKLDNAYLRQELTGWALAGVDRAAIEMVASYGMAVGADVFETCVWIGRFCERSPRPLQRVFRRDIKLHHCGSARAKDSNIIQALVDRFTPGQPNKGKGTKAKPGWFHGFHSDIWQAAALAIYLADTSESRKGVA